MPTTGAYDSRDYSIYLANTKNEIFIPTTIVDDNRYVSDVVLPDGEYFVTVRARNTKYYRLISDVGVYEFSVTPESVTHTITVNATEGGTASGSGTYSDGASVTVSAVASEGYEFKGWTENGSIVSTEARYIFEATADRTLTATFEKKQAPAPITYTVSVSAGPAAGGTVTGSGTYGNGLFGPDDHITREQLAVMLWRYAGEPAATNKELHFSDVDKVSGYALDALCWATENGIINGKGSGILDPRGQATRAQVAQMLMNYLKK